MVSKNVRIEYVYCEVHEKRGYSSKREAKRAAKRWHPGEHLDAYPCDRGTGLWHIGHLPSGVLRRGTVDRRTLATGPRGAGK